MRSNSQQIISYCLGLCTQNPGLREVDLKPSPERGSDKINTLKKARNIPKESKLYHTVWTHIWISGLRKVDLDPVLKEEQIDHNPREPLLIALKLAS